ncbi:MAG: hypothetical protein WB444_01600, partial [Gallionella sp.]
NLKEKERAFITNFDQYLISEKKVPAEKPNTRTKKDNESTLPTYIRNCINHPNNGYVFTKAELEKSIKMLLEVSNKG